MKLILFFITCLTVCLAVAPTVFAQGVSDAAESGASLAVRRAVTAPAEKREPIRIPRLAHPPMIDGDISEEIWNDAVEMKDFYQIQPGDNITPSRSTVVRIGHDAKYLYFAFHCFDDPGSVRATLAQRDNVFGEDNIRVFLDTFNDKRRAYVLGFNPYGIQQDGIYTNGGNTDYTVDVVMESKGRIVADGWTVEAAVPFKSLRFEAGQGKSWGFHIWRNIDRFNDEMDSWMPISRDVFGNLNQAGRITGLEDLETERLIEVIPTFSVAQNGRRTRSGGFVNPPLQFAPGLNLKFGVTPNITLDATINPDFADVEADQPVVTTNQRFPIFFPERRPFFLEGKDIFETPIQVVNTRSIVDPDWALKLSGKRGRLYFGAMLASDNAPGNYTEDERNDPAIRPRIARFLDKNATIGVLRLKRDVGLDGSIGMTATSYNFVDRYNQVAGVDGRFRLDNQTTFTFQVLGSHSRRNFFEPEFDRTRYRTGNGMAYAVNFNRSARFLRIDYSGNGQSTMYRSDVGFLRRTDTNQHRLAVEYNSDPRPRSPIIQWGFSNFSRMSFDWRGRSQNWATVNEIRLRMQKQSNLGFGYERGYERLFEREFGAMRSATNPGTFAGSDPERATGKSSIFAFGGITPSLRVRLNGSVSYDRGVFDFDFGAGRRFPRVSPAALLDPKAPLDPGAGRGVAAEGSLELRPITAINATVRYNYNSLTRDDTQRLAFRSHIVSLRLVYQFSQAFFLRERLDYDSVSANFRQQLLFGWAPNPGTAVYVGYNDNVNRNGFNPFTGVYEPGLRRNNRTFFVKVSYLFRRTIKR